MTITDEQLKSIIYHSEEIELVNYRIPELINNVGHSLDIDAIIVFEYDLEDYEYKTNIKEVYGIDLVDSGLNSYDLTDYQKELIQKFLDKHLKGMEYYGNSKLLAV